MNSLRSVSALVSLGSIRTCLIRWKWNFPTSSCVRSICMYIAGARAPVQVAILGDQPSKDARFHSIGELAEDQLNSKIKKSIKRARTPNLDWRYKLYKRERLAFHIKGYDIGRFGTIELVTLLFEKPPVDKDDYTKGVIDDGLPDCFILDVGQHVEESERLKRIEIIRQLFQTVSDLIKVTHNGAMTADALLHILDVKIDAVADTSCYHRVYSEEPETVSLQEAMEFAGFTPPSDSSEYDLTAGFWAKRPLTDEMIQICVQEVKPLHWLVRKQASAMKKKMKMAMSRTKSAKLINSVRNLEVTILQEQEPDMELDFKNWIKYNLPLRKHWAMVPVPGEDGKWRCYHKYEEQLQIVRKALGYT